MWVAENNDGAPFGYDFEKPKKNKKGDCADRGAKVCGGQKLSHMYNPVSDVWTHFSCKSKKVCGEKKCTVRCRNEK